MIEPSIDSLREKVESKYTLVTLAAQRAREIRETGRSVLEHPKSTTEVGIALEEVKAEKLFVKEK
ncbi:MAG TPA: DNA-directed RNA polymerase subunit omega [Bacillota bacterium]|nr:DNA-directed RNA polymerase subunit omega [Bacillota bacterium]